MITDRKATSFQLPVTRPKTEEATSCRLQASGFRLQATGFRVKTYDLKTCGLRHAA